MSLIKKNTIILLLGVLLILTVAFTACNGGEGNVTTDPEGSTREPVFSSENVEPSSPETNEETKSPESSAQTTEEKTEITSESTTENVTSESTSSFETTGSPTTEETTASAPETTEEPIVEYVVQKGDTLSKIASKFGIDMDVIASFNKIENVSFIYVGQILKIPPKNYTGFDPNESRETVDVTSPAEPLDTIIHYASGNPTENPEESVRLSFIGMGDNLIHQNINAQSLQSNGKYNFLPKYESVADIIKNADIAFINQEAPICGNSYGITGYPRFNAPEEMIWDLERIGFDVWCFANNHVADKGMQGIGSMLGLIKTSGMMYTGIYDSKKDSETIRIYEKEGVKIAFLAYTYGTNMYGKKNTYSTYSYWIPVINRDNIIREVKAAREYADIVIVSMHWGAENKFGLNYEQAEYSQLLADLGVDVILGHHPHVVQKIERIKGQNGNETVCYYSLGNGINSQTPLNNVIGIMASFDIVKDKNGARIENVKCIPTIAMQERNSTNVRLIPISEMTEDLAKIHNCNYTDRKVTMAAIRKVLTDNIDAEYLPLYITDPNSAVEETTTAETSEKVTDPPTTENQTTEAPTTDTTIPDEPKLTVCIDPGHQIKGISETEPNGPGSTVMKKKLSSGTAGVYTGIPEYQLNLDVSLMLKAELIKRGYNVIMIRETNDCPKSNAERAVIANESGADIFVRIHANGSSNSEVNGALCCAPTENNPFLTAENIAASRKLSEIVVNNMCRETGAKNRGLYNVDTMTGINWCTIPVTIVEMGYMSNVEEDKLMATEEYRLKIVDGVADGIDEYFGR